MHGWREVSFRGWGDNGRGLLGTGLPLGCVVSVQLHDEVLPRTYVHEDPEMRVVEAKRVTVLI